MTPPRALLGVGTAVAVTFALAGTPTIASNWGQRNWCGPRDTSPSSNRYVHTRSRSRKARIYTVYDDVRACLFSVGRSWSLTPATHGDAWSGGSEEADLFVFSGPLVAYNYDAATPVDCEERVRVLDLRTGRLRRSLVTGKLHPIPNPPDDYFPPCAVYPRRIVVKRSASVAWIGLDNSDYSAPLYEVYRVDSRGRVNLDNGTAIDPKSLRRRGSTIYWTNAGVVKSAALH